MARRTDVTVWEATLVHPDFRGRARRLEAESWDNRRQVSRDRRRFEAMRAVSVDDSVDDGLARIDWFAEEPPRRNRT